MHCTYCGVAKPATLIEAMLANKKIAPVVQAIKLIAITYAETF